MSSQCISETRAAYDTGYVSSIYQLACAVGRIGGDSLQSVGSKQTNTLQFKSIRFDDPNTPIIDMTNHRINLLNSQKVYSVSVNVQTQSTDVNPFTNTVSLWWFDGTSEKEIASIDVTSNSGSAFQNYQLTTLVKSNDKMTNGKNNNYLCAKLINNSAASVSVTKLRFSVVRCV